MEVEASGKEYLLKMPGRKKVLKAGKLLLTLNQSCLMAISSPLGKLKIAFQPSITWLQSYHLARSCMYIKMPEKPGFDAALSGTRRILIGKDN